eukprot:3163739-Prorocentrum_lima.AAC.1
MERFDQALRVNGQRFLATFTYTQMDGSSINLFVAQALAHELAVHYNEQNQGVVRIQSFPSKTKRDS